MKLESLLNEYVKEKVSVLITKILKTAKAVEREASKLMKGSEPVAESEDKTGQTSALLALTDLTQDMKTGKKDLEGLLKSCRADLSTLSHASINRAINMMDGILECLSDLMYSVSVSKKAPHKEGMELAKKMEAFNNEFNDKLMPALRSDGLLNVSVRAETFKRHHL